MYAFYKTKLQKCACSKVKKIQLKPEDLSHNFRIIPPRVLTTYPTVFLFSSISSLGFGIKDES